MFHLAVYSCRKKCKQEGVPFEERVLMNYDHPDSLETDLLVEHLKELKAGRAIDCPLYDYSLHNRSDEVIRIEPKPVILVEGILLLADERIRDLLDIKIYVEADADERILRRISRDVEER
nr:hypothetical protein [[Ruminococcus] torques]